MDDSLHGMNIFVGGPIQHALDDRRMEGRLQGYIESAIGLAESLGATVFSAHRAEKFGGETHLFTPDEVSLRDHAWMEKCDVFVAILPVCHRSGSLLRTDGTHIELGWASALRRAIVLVTAKPFDATASHLLKGLGAVANVEHISLQEFERRPQVLVDVVAAMVR
jgi:nucleoside 2-deoxyribosyltransferase